MMSICKVAMFVKPICQTRLKNMVITLFKAIVVPMHY